MRVIGWILAACMALAIIRLTLAGLIVVFAVLLLWGLFTRPRETCSFMALAVAVNLVESNPWLALGMLAAALLIWRHEP